MINQFNSIIFFKSLLAYSEWSDWSNCTKDCDSGNITRTRTCLINNCDEKLFETAECNKHICLTDSSVYWSEWSIWSYCKLIDTYS